MARNSDDTRLAEALVARLTSDRGSAALPQAGLDMAGTLVAGELAVDVAVKVRQIVSYDVRASLRDYALAALAAHPNEARQSCGCTTTKRNPWSWSGRSGSCSKPITHVVVTVSSSLPPWPHRHGEYGPWPPHLSFRCGVHAEPYAPASGGEFKAVLELPKAALQVIRDRAKREEWQRRVKEERVEAFLRWGRWFVTEMKRPAPDDLAKARSARAAREGR